MTPLRIRPALPGDSSALAAIVGAHVRAGSGTAIAAPPSPGTVCGWWMTGPRALLCHVAADRFGVIGVQAVERHPRLPAGWGDVATFVRPGCGRLGAGRALFAATRARAAALGLAWLAAVIRAENAAGLGYYRAMGFRDWRRLPDGRLMLRRGTGR